MLIQGKNCHVGRCGCSLTASITRPYSLPLGPLPAQWRTCLILALMLLVRLVFYIVTAQLMAEQNT